MIKVENLKKRYGKYEALKSISFEVEKGSVFGFIGRNGAGKTTTMNILAGLLKFDDGRIFFEEKDFIKERNQVMKLIGYLPETPSFYNYMNSYEYLSFIGDILGIGTKDKARKVSDLLGITRLTKKQAKRRIGGYSRGMKQRLALAVALMNKPEVLLLDEPASALDPEGRLEMLELIEELKDENITIFLSTHILNDAERVCNKICIIDEGKILIDKDLEELKKQYIQPIFDIEFEKDPAGQISIFKNLNWVENIKTNGRILSLYVSDIENAKKQVLKELPEINTFNNIVSYQIRKSTLEDIFIRMVNKNGLV
ncbi:MAG: ABC transporter ATP-binding protein [Candidatus Humimicrobiaceae bacterium]